MRPHGVESFPPLGAFLSGNKGLMGTGQYLGHETSYRRNFWARFAHLLKERKMELSTIIAGTVFLVIVGTIIVLLTRQKTVEKHGFPESRGKE